MVPALTPRPQLRSSASRAFHNCDGGTPARLRPGKCSERAACSAAVE